MVASPPSRAAGLPDDMPLAEVAARLGKSRRWLEGRLAEDGRKRPGQQRLQHHHYVGASRRWDESEYQALREAIWQEDTAKRRLAPASSSGRGTGTSSAHFGLMDAQSAFAAVLSFRPGLNSGAMPMPSGTGGAPRSGGKSSTASSRPSRSRLRPTST